MEEFQLFENKNNQKKYIIINIVSFLVLNYIINNANEEYFTRIQKLIINIIFFFLIKILFFKIIFKQIIKIYENFGLEIWNHHLNKSITKKFYHFDDIEECLIYEYIGVVSVHYKLGIKIYGQKDFVEGIQVI